MKRIILTVILMLYSFYPHSEITAQILQDLTFPASNSIILMFDSPEAIERNMFSSELSEDKTSIKLDMLAVEYSDELTNQIRSGKINGVYYTNMDSHLVIDIKMNDSYGYTCVPQPLTASLVLTIFKWNEIDKGEDSYRAAQLAMESDIDEEVISNLIDAIDNGSQPAQALLAFIQSNENPATSVEQFKNSKPDHTLLPDVAFVASDLLGKSGFDNEAAKWMERYEFLTGNKINEEIQPSTFLDDLITENVKDKAEDEIPASEIASSSGENKNWDDIFLLIGISLSSIAILTLILVLFQRRKRKQLEKHQLTTEVSNEVRSETFEEQLLAAKLRRRKTDTQAENASELISQIASSKSETNKNNLLSNKIDKLINDTPSISIESKDELFPDEETGSLNVHIEEKKNDIEAFLQSFIPQRRTLEEQSSNDLASTIRNVVNEVELKNLENTAHMQTAELELALKIAEKENNNKFNKLRKLSLENLEGNQRLEELSKQLNIDQTTLSAKKKVADLQVNKSRLSKLSKRFDVK